jgi:hypothetical protein
MMSNVIEFKRERWCAGPVECFQCKHEWVGVWPEGLLHLYCPECDGPYGLPVDAQAPVKQLWQGLNENDRLRLNEFWRKPGVGPDNLIEAVEQILRAKNQ